ncbi:MAG: hypothetical protein M3Q95_06145 [Bacteroidota bacterium]|nr:hypothetical protein [Bacteroidota bacterium]
MKTFLFVMLYLTIVFTGCSNNSSTDDTHEHEEGTSHAHENGEVHQDHDTIQQQEFTVEQDSASHQHHNHNGDSTHSHPN